MKNRCSDLGLSQACDISTRLVTLGVDDSYPLWKAQETVNWRLKKIIGCLAKAVMWMHSQNVLYRDLKPQNALLRPGQVYLTHFGILRAAANATTQSYMGSTRGWAAPEVEEQGDVNPAQVDVYSLGCIYLHMLTVMVGWKTGARRKALTAILSGDRYKRGAELRRFMEDVMKLPKEETGPKPRLTIQLLAPLVANDRKSRPDVKTVDGSLWGAGWNGKVFYGQCCRGKPAPAYPVVRYTKYGTSKLKTHWVMLFELLKLNALLKLGCFENPERLPRNGH